MPPTRRAPTPPARPRGAPKAAPPAAAAMLPRLVAGVVMQMVQRGVLAPGPALQRGPQSGMPPGGMMAPGRPGAAPGRPAADPRMLAMMAARARGGR